ncbi:MAG: hypothetical protein UT77_C0008G0024 [Candidatus Daviesbacteria bacterium GW2011_GWC2_40_12]|uniref:Uncharacterized protein n=1 Tax=Candidatus Daviesbacteria bacterium GW2011_GWC2_40_12 TaxID=1618431 RepID=A0A0G0TUT4_9BACT|nr:MAG: hypothetical protein UT04_C0002G0004 [Candidatus Daviesbacteria bacterium GW2011_GWF2_38_7]KKR16084.1 MAG: hypothetical protein UT45_C0009G0024 [Candidatus Daviesbacteria bacterium GW2011_GWA2_39_33]KKR41652.1 MAG: hypothetical protein UT77_C0008G0024 [Candidatus Daviesbacteria bacterium GW2011_GWC2_40_12]
MPNILPYPPQEVDTKLTKNTATPIPTYSQTTLPLSLLRRFCVVNPKRTYIADEIVKDRIVTGEGQKEKLRASSPNTRLKIKLCTSMAIEILSSIEIVQRSCKIRGKLTKKITIPFHKNNKLKAKTTWYIKKAERSVKRKLAVEAALYKGMVRKLATLKTFCASNNK